MGYADATPVVKHKRYTGDTPVNLTSDLPASAVAVVGVAAVVNGAFLYYAEGANIEIVGQAFSNISPFYLPFPFPLKGDDSGGTARDLSVNGDNVASDYTVYYIESAGK